jgi:hypothetical protein
MRSRLFTEDPATPGFNEILAEHPDLRTMLYWDFETYYSQPFNKVDKPKENKISPLKMPKQRKR